MGIVMKYAKFVCTITFAVMMLAFSNDAYCMNFEPEAVYESVVVVYSEDSLGSGFAIGENYIVTNAHVISGKSVSIRTYADTESPAFVVAMDSELDIALLYVEDRKFVPLHISLECKVGEDVYAIGAPESLAYTLTKGVVSSKNRNVSGSTFIQTDAAINPGNSGGPLLNDNGEVIGVNSYKLNDSEGIGLAIPAVQLLDYLADQGITVNDNGNVTGQPEPDEDSAEENADESNSSDEINALKQKYEDKIMALTVLLAIAVMIIITLVVVIVSGKQRAARRRRESTDFEIDTWE